MMDRLMGVLTLKAPVYKEIAEDKNATTTAAIIVVVMALLSGILGGVVLGAVTPSVPGGPSPPGFAVRTIASAIIGWLVGSWVIAFVANLFGGKTDTGEMLRVFGFTQIFTILAIVPVCGAIAGLILSLFAAVIGIREAAGFGTYKAALTGIVAFIALFSVTVVVSIVIAAVQLV